MRQGRHNDSLLYWTEKEGSERWSPPARSHSWQAAELGFEPRQKGPDSFLQASAKRDCISQGVLRDVLSHHYMVTRAQRPAVSMPQLTAGVNITGLWTQLTSACDGAAGQAAGSGGGEALRLVSLSVLSLPSSASYLTSGSSSSR